MVVPWLILILHDGSEWSSVCRRRKAVGYIAGTSRARGGEGEASATTRSEARPTLGRRGDDLEVEKKPRDLGQIIASVCWTPSTRAHPKLTVAALEPSDSFLPPSPRSLDEAARLGDPTYIRNCRDAEADAHRALHVAVHAVAGRVDVGLGV